MVPATMSPQEIRRLRTQLGWTQSELGEHAGVGRTAVTLWELGKRNPSRAASRLLAMLQEQAKGRRKSS